MGCTSEFLRGLLLLILVLGMPACAPADVEGKSFDIPAQPAASALNEFAKQADVTLIFSYDLVAGERTRPLRGGLTVDDGLTQLLAGTSLGYQQAVDGTYLICALSSCGRAPAAEPATANGRKDSARVSGGNTSPTRL